MLQDHDALAQREICGGRPMLAALDWRLTHAGGGGGCAPCTRSPTPQLPPPLHHHHHNNTGLGSALQAAVEALYALHPRPAELAAAILKHMRAACLPDVAPGDFGCCRRRCRLLLLASPLHPTSGGDC
jgi:hypothetical protein